MPSDQARAGPARVARHPVRVVSLKTGITAHALRAWERRYGVVAPVRTEGGQRLYSDADIERLRLLKVLTDSGYAIGRLADLPATELRRLHGVSPRTGAKPAEVAAPENGASSARATVLDSIVAFDAGRLRRELQSASVALGVAGFLDQVLGPVLTEIGERWRAGTLSIAHEHLATAQVREVLGWIRDTAEPPGSAPVLVVATPAGQLHEGGALILAAALAAEGWRVAYLGPNLPALEIAQAARRTGARAVALSLIHPSDDPAIPGELRALRKALPRRTALLVGGGAAPAYAAAIEAAQGKLLPDLPAARAILRGLARQHAVPADGAA